MLIDTDDLSDVQKASLFLQAIGFADATPENRQRLASLLDTLRTACEAQDPDCERISIDNQQLTVQLEGMVERILDGEPLTELSDDDSPSP